LYYNLSIDKNPGVSDNFANFEPTLWFMGFQRALFGCQAAMGRRQISGWGNPPSSARRQ